MTSSPPLKNAIYETDESHKELWLTLIFNLSRAFIDPDLDAIRRARHILGGCKHMKLASLTPDQENYFKQILGFFKETLVTTAADSGLRKFLVDIGLPETKVTAAINIGKEMKLQY
eukprot:TRINITY_DN14384_c0_g2_i1.p6 TRINITY_DN14384_c0_g2~~TRINITY_DN14384_c0_g2_i1.p6  ORF type:complete len:116 (-),score=10.45 TRINITY_DN14384_c0_g2_i1:574-921(-)